MQIMCCITNGEKTHRDLLSVQLVMNPLTATDRYEQSDGEALQSESASGSVQSLEGTTSTNQTSSNAFVETKLM